MNHMNISLAKSTIRIIFCVVAVSRSSVEILAWGMGIAELLGVAEEIFDKRKED